MSSQDLAVVAAGVPAAQLDFAEMMRRAAVLAKTELVPKPLQGKPEAIVVIGVWGAEHGVPLMTAIQEVHVIENRPSPSAQLRLALIRRAGHEARFLDTDSTKAVLRARRREYRNDPDAWVTVTYTIDDARKAGLLDRWVERWVERRKQTWKIGDDLEWADITGAPEWVPEAVAGGDIRMKDNWAKYPADMLRARAASVMSRMEFSDVLAALDIEPLTPEELGVDIGQDVDEPADPQDPSDEDGDAEEVEDAVVVEDLAPGPEPTTNAPAPAPDEAPPTPARSGPPVPRPAPGERPDVTVLKWRLNSLDSDGKKSMRAWFAANDIPDLADVSEEIVAKTNAELDRRGVAQVTTTGHDTLLPPETDG